MEVAELFIQDKQVLSASLLLAADRLADKLIFQDGKYLKADDIKPYLVTQLEADVNYRCYQWLLGYIAANPRRFDPADVANGELWGVQESNDVVYINRAVFDRILHSEGYSPGAFLTWAKRNKKIEADDYDDNKRLTRRKTIGGQRVPCIALILDNSEDEEVTKKISEETEDERDAYAKFIAVDVQDMPF